MLTEDWIWMNGRFRKPKTIGYLLLYLDSLLHVVLVLSSLNSNFVSYFWIIAFKTSLSFIMATLPQPNTWKLSI